MIHGDSENMSHLVASDNVATGAGSLKVGWGVPGSGIVGSFWFSNKCTLGIPSRNSHRYLVLL